MAVTSSQAFLELLEKSRLLSDERLQAVRAGASPEADAKTLATKLVKEGTLNKWQALNLLAGRHALTLGKYKLLDQLTADDRERIYAAEHIQLGRRVVIKSLARQHVSKNPAAVKAFLERARSAAGLDHRSIVHIYDVDCQDDRYYVVMEHVEGRSLQEILDESGSLTAPRAARYAQQAAAALAYAHQRPAVHGELCPANLLIDSEDCVRVANFGIGGLAATKPAGPSSGSGELSAPASYAAPESAEGLPQNPAQDIYALGCILHVLLTGRPVQTEGRPPSLPGARPEPPEILTAICREMTSRDPEARPSATDVQTRLERFLSREPQTAEPTAKTTEPAPSPTAGDESAAAATVAPKDATATGKPGPAAERPRPPEKDTKKAALAATPKKPPPEKPAAGATTEKEKEKEKPAAETPAPAPGAPAGEAGAAPLDFALPDHGSHGSGELAVGDMFGEVTIDTRRPKGKKSAKKASVAKSPAAKKEPAANGEAAGNVFARIPKVAYLIGGGGLAVVAALILALVFVFSGDGDKEKEKTLAENKPKPAAEEPEGAAAETDAAADSSAPGEPVAPGDGQTAAPGPEVNPTLVPDDTDSTPPATAEQPKAEAQPPAAKTETIAAKPSSIPAKAIPAKPAANPAASAGAATAVPAKSGAIPAKPVAGSAKPETPAKPEAAPAKSEAAPAKSDTPAAKADTPPAKPEPPPEPEPKPPPPPPKPSKKPFEEFPKVVSLPSVDAADATTPKPLGKVYVPAEAFFSVKLGGGEHAMKGDAQAFTLRNAQGGTATADWEIFVQQTDTGEQVKLAHLSLADDAQLAFNWQPEAKDHPATPQLMNCLLKFNCAEASHVAVLRSSSPAAALAIDTAKPSVKEEFKIDALPDPQFVKVEITGVKGTTKHTVEPTPVLDADKGEAWVKVEDGGLSFKVETMLRRGLLVTVTPYLQVGPEAKPEKFNAKKMQQAQQQLQFAIQGLTNQIAQGKLAAKAKEEHGRRQIEQYIQTWETELESAKAAEGRLANVDKLLKGIKPELTMRVFYQVDATNSDLQVNLLQIGG